MRARKCHNVDPQKLDPAFIFHHMATSKTATTLPALHKDNAKGMNSITKCSSNNNNVLPVIKNHSSNNISILTMHVFNDDNEQKNKSLNNNAN